MGFDIPDGPQAQISIEVIGTTPTTPEPATEHAIASYGTLTNATINYGVVKLHTVTTGRMLVLRAVEMACTDYSIATWKLLVGGITVFEDVKFPEAFTKAFPDLKLTAGAQVVLYMKSDGTNSITAYADFDAKEVG